MKSSGRIGFLLLVFLVSNKLIFSDIIYVKESASGTGGSWLNAYGDLQAALEEAENGDEIWVAAGTYYPASDYGLGIGDRGKHFRLKNGVRLYGGFAGSEPNTFDVSDRDIVTNETVLSGDLLGNDKPLLDPSDLLDDPDRSDNCYHVFYHPSGTLLDPNAVLDGFTLTGGNSNQPAFPHSSGGGMFNHNSSPALKNCTFSNCSAGAYGGAVVNYSNSSPEFFRCTFSGNSAQYGGGMDNFSESSPYITGSTFTGNCAGTYGGGMDNYINSSPAMSFCTFSGNFAGIAGGAVNTEQSSSPSINDTILWDNAAPNGNAISLLSASIELAYCDIQGGLADIYDEDSGNTVHWYTGNIDFDPYFVVPGRWVNRYNTDLLVEPLDPNAVWLAGDCHLKSEGWRWDSVRCRWTYDEVTSRCIDAGNPGLLPADELMSVPEDPCNVWGENIRINMGAYGGTAKASMPPYNFTRLTDLTNDGIVNFMDYAHGAALNEVSGEELPADFDHNGRVDVNDHEMLINQWLQETTWFEP